MMHPTGPSTVDSVDMFFPATAATRNSTAMPQSCSAKDIKKEKPVHPCKVCGDATTGFCFGALVCQSCKTFFIRCESEGARPFVCLNRNRCIVTKVSRTFCKHCRLAKCYAVGMKRKDRPEIIEPAQGQELCAVCNDVATGVHFGKLTCEGCKKFFRRSLKGRCNYRCRKSGKCAVNPRSRTRCRACRFKKCVDVGLLSKARRSRLFRYMQTNANEKLLDQIPDSPVSGSEQQSESEEPKCAVSEGSGTGRPTVGIENRLDPTSEKETQMLVETPPPEAHCHERLCQVTVEGVNYLLSETLGLRYLNVVLPYWTQPHLPPGDVVYGPEERAAVEQLTRSHSRAVEELRGPPPSVEIIAEALISSEASQNVAQFQRERLVRTMLAFLGHIESQQILSGLSEEQVTRTIRLTVNTWALIGVACRFFTPDKETLPFLQDLPLHPTNPHTPVTACNLSMARRLHALKLDEAEAALLAVSCILASDLFEVKEPDVVERKRWQVLELFRAYTSYKHGWPNGRVEELFSCVPEMRLIAIWFNDLSYTTWYPPKNTK